MWHNLAIAIEYEATFEAYRLRVCKTWGYGAIMEREDFYWEYIASQKEPVQS